MPRDANRRRFLKIAGAAVASTPLIGSASAAGRGSGTRYAAFNVVDLNTDQVQQKGDEQAAAAARVIQEIDPDIIVINELANNIQKAKVTDGVPTEKTNIQAFVDNYLSEPQHRTLDGIEYPHTLQPTSNTGVLPEEPYDFNKDGNAGERPGDAFGFGVFPGQYGFGIASKYPIAERGIRSFQKFHWDDMPGNLIPIEGEAGVDPDGIYLTESETDIYRLSSKTHIDVPFAIDGKTVHGLFSHPTPPVFDGLNNFNGKWNHDEVRFFADYVAMQTTSTTTAARQVGSQTTPPMS